MIIDVIIPALNEEKSIPKVISFIDRSLVRHVVVADNGSSDSTAEVAAKAGAIVVSEPFRGYGAACLKAADWIKSQEIQPDIIAYIDGDFSDYPEQLSLIIAPIIEGKADLVIGSRALGKRIKGSMMPQQIFGNWLATRLIKLFYGVRFTDLGPFRAITKTAYDQIGMIDRTYGWTVEMQVKAVKAKLKCVEVAVDYRPRIGKSKVAGTLKGTVLAGYKIITTIFRYL